jgi:hypothetical protein
MSALSMAILFSNNIIIAHSLLTNLTGIFGIEKKEETEKKSQKIKQ